MTSTNDQSTRKRKDNLLDDYNNTRLHYACALNNFEVVKQEIDAGQKIDPENYLGWTPLMMALRNGNANIVNYLIEHKANATKKNQYGVSVFLLSVTSGNLEMCKLIFEHLLCSGISRLWMQQQLSPISLAIIFGQSQIFKYLIQRKFDIDAASPVTLLTPLMFAAALENNHAIKKLINLRANTKAKNYLGFTAQDITEQRTNNVISIGKKKNTETKPQAPEVNQQPQQPVSNMPLIVVSHQPPASVPGVPISPFNNNMFFSDAQLRNSSNVSPFFISPALSPIVGQPQFVFAQNLGTYSSPAVCTPNYLLNENFIEWNVSPIQ